MKAPEFIQNIHWELLREQKSILLGLIEFKQLGEPINENLTGIVHLIDAVQDFATDEMGVPESVVFGKEFANIQKAKAIESMLFEIYSNIGIGTPSNHSDILQFVFDDVCQTADPDNWHSGDVAIAFRRWMEEKK